MSQLTLSKRNIIGLGGLNNTDYSDINEGFTFLTLVNSDLTLQIISYLQLKDFNSAIDHIDQFRDFELEQDEFLIARLIEILSKAVEPAAILGVIIKAQQGYNQGILIQRTLGEDITQVFFTNKRNLLVNALSSIDDDSKVLARFIADKNLRDHPADILVVLNDEIPVGISLKASYSKIEPTVCNYGMNSPLGVIPPICSRADADFCAVGKSLIAQTIVKFDDSDKCKALLQNLLHIQEANLPYFLIASSGENVYGIDFLKFKDFICGSDNFSIDTKLSNKDSQLLNFKTDGMEGGFLVRAKFAGSKNNTQKVNVSLDKKFNEYLKKTSKIVLKGGSKIKKGGMRLRSGFEYGLPLPEVEIENNIYELAESQNLHDINILDELLAEDEELDETIKEHRATDQLLRDSSCSEQKKGGKKSIKKYKNKKLFSKKNKSHFF